jgi:transposase
VSERKDKKIVKFNNEETLKFKKRYAGFFCLISPNNKDCIDTLHIYRNKDTVENAFDDLKNSLDMKRLRIHSSDAMDSRLFIQFLALIIVSKIRKICKEHKKLRYLTVREILEDLETLVQTSFEGRYKKLYSEIYPRQQMILDAFELRWPI